MPTQRARRPSVCAELMKIRNKRVNQTYDLVMIRRQRRWAIGGDVISKIGTTKDHQVKHDP
jgi:hypothetical protein